MNNKPKIIVAVVCLALAGVAILWQTGVFAGKAQTNAAPPPSDDIVDSDDFGDDSSPSIGATNVLAPTP